MKVNSATSPTLKLQYCIGWLFFNIMTRFTYISLDEAKSTDCVHSTFSFLCRFIVSNLYSTLTAAQGFNFFFYWHCATEYRSTYLIPFDKQPLNKANKHTTPIAMTRHTSQLIHSSFYLFKFVLPACRPHFIEFPPSHKKLGARGSAVGWGTTLQVGRSRVRFPMLSLVDIILPAALWPWGRLGL